MQKVNIGLWEAKIPMGTLLLYYESGQALLSIRGYLWEAALDCSDL